MLKVQSTNHVLMIRPAAFNSNASTLADNSFQNPALQSEWKSIQAVALAEFDAMVRVLRGHGVQVRVFEDRPELNLPDAIFPNNWISTSPDGTLTVYPMRSEIRRNERREDLIAELKKEWPRIQDLRLAEDRGLFLEGTGSLVIDHINSTVYACLSQRTNAEMVAEWAEQNNMRAVVFNALDSKRVAVYHTNVVMGIGTGYAVVCLDAISDQAERKKVSQSLIDSGHELIEISVPQMEAFCGNVLELCSKDSSRLLLMSGCAFRNFGNLQKSALLQHVKFIMCDIPTIEKYGGGSARCMLAELF